MKDERTVPKLRFPDFEEVWERRKIKEMFKITRGYVLATSLTDENPSTEKPYPVYSSQTKNNGLMGYYKDFLYEDAITWTTDGANAGTVNYREGKFYCTNVCGVLLADNIVPNQMIAEALNNVAKSYVSYVGNPKLMNNVMAEIEISLPSDKKERERISSFFSTIDTLITLQQRKLDQIKEYKKGMLQKMFPKEGESVPEVRFPGFTGEWERHTIADVAGKVYGGGTPKTSVDEYWNGDIPWIQSSNVSEHELFFVNVQKYITESGLRESATQLVPANSIAVVSHVGVGKLVFVPFEYTTSQDFISLSELKSEPVFTSYALYKRLQEDQHIVQGSAIKGITKNVLLSKEILLPNIAEQNKIGKVLQNIDTLITLHQRKLEAMKEYKKGLLQQMFV